MVPDHKTIADFRKDNGPAIRRTCARFVDPVRRIVSAYRRFDRRERCHRRQQVRSKFRAVNHRDRNFTAGKSAVKAETLDVIADRGYFNGAKLLACHEDGIAATAPRPETSGNRKKGMFVKSDFIYDTNTCTCPAGNVLTYRNSREEDGLMRRRYWQNECQHCSLKVCCTTGKVRRITRWEHEYLIDTIQAS